jgi:hypothetical protein
MRDSKKRPDRADVLKKVFTSPLYILITIITAIVYYGLFYYLILTGNKGVFLVTVPIYLVYALVVSASVLLALSIFAVAHSIRTKYAGAEGGLLSIVTAAFGDLIVGCSCYAPILSSVMYAIGFGTLQVGDMISFLGVYQAWFVVAFIAVNLIFIYYQLGRIIRIGSAERRR